MPLTLVEYDKYLGFKRDKFSDFLPYETYDPESGFFVSIEEVDPYVGFIYECYPFSFAGEDQFKTVQQILECPFPERTFVQFILAADPRVDGILDFFIGLRKKAHEKRLGEILLSEGLITETELKNALEIQKKEKKKLGEILVQEGIVDAFAVNMALKKQMPLSKEWAIKYAEFIRSHTEEGFYPDVPVPVRNFRLFIAVKVQIDPDDDLQEIFGNLKNIRDDIESSLVASYFVPKLLSPQELIESVYWWLNPGVREDIPPYDETIPIRKQVLSPQSYYRWKPAFRRCRFFINDYAVSVMNVYRYPEKVDSSDVLPLIGDFMNQNLKQILCPFILTLNVYTKPANTSVMLWAERMFSQNIGGTGGYRLEVKKKEAEKALKLMEEEKEIFQRFSLTLTLFSRPKFYERDVGSAKTLWKRRGFHLIEESVYPLAPFIFALPFGPKLNKQTTRYIQDRYRVAPVKTIKELAPIQADWKGTGKPAMLFVSRRGQLVSFDFFSGSETNFNAIVYAGSRAGKSFLVNYVTTCYHGIGAQIWIIDIGRSYERLTKFLGGDYLSFSRKENICLNPFSYTVGGEDLETSLELISYVIAKMAKPETGCDQEEINFIKEAVRAAWDKYEQDATITNVADFLSRRGKEKAHKLADLLVDYTHGGPYASLFDGPANVDLSGRNLLTVELEEFSKIPALRSVVLALVLYQIQEACYSGDRSIPKLIIMDEAWQFFEDDDPMIAKFMEHGFRRIAKYGGSFIVITQGLEDFYVKNKKIGQAIISSSAHQIILKHDPSVIDKLVAEKKLNVPESFKEYLKSIHIIKGKYSEFCIRTEGIFSGISRLFVDDFTFTLFTTDAEKVAYLEKLMGKGLTLAEAIEEAIRTNFGGTALDTVKRAENEYIKTQKELIEYIKGCDPHVLQELKRMILTNGVILEETRN